MRDGRASLSACRSSRSRAARIAPMRLPATHSPTACRCWRPGQRSRRRSGDGSDWSPLGNSGRRRDERRPCTSFFKITNTKASFAEPRDARLGCESCRPLVVGVRLELALAGFEEEQAGQAPQNRAEAPLDNNAPLSNVHCDLCASKGRGRRGGRGEGGGNHC